MKERSRERSLLLLYFYSTDALTGSTTKNYVYAAPSSAAGTPSFRALVAADIPSLAASKITSGTLSSSRLPISTSQTNSTSKVPSSSLVYSMNQKITELNNAIANIELQVDDPNDRYSPTNLGTWSSASDVNTFFSRFNHANGYKDGNTKLKVGNYVTIQDGTYNAVWEIAGFDMESNQEAADGTTFDNGYGICMIPRTNVTTGQWNESASTVGGYKSSYMHTTLLPGIVTKLKTILGSHIVNRNVLLSSSTNKQSSAYTWTTAYATLMSVGQMSGNFAANRNKYDDGEANYKLPIFNYKDFKTGSHFWTRCILNNGNVYYVFSDGSIETIDANGSRDVRPLIYLR